MPGTFAIFATGATGQTRGKGHEGKSLSGLYEGIIGSMTWGA